MNKIRKFTQVLISNLEVTGFLMRLKYRLFVSKFMISLANDGKKGLKAMA